jgi:MFS superfamily sulfate permease-like transporter
VATPVRRLLPAALQLAPFVAVCVLFGFVVGWWVPVIFAVVCAVVVGWAVVYRRRLRRLQSHPDAMRAHEERMYWFSVRWAKIWGLLLAGMMIFLVVLAVALLVAERV